MYIMHPALRKGPLFKKPFSTFFYKKHPPFHFLPTGLERSMVMWPLAKLRGHLFSPLGLCEVQPKLYVLLLFLFIFK